MLYCENDTSYIALFLLGYKDNYFHNSQQKRVMGTDTDRRNKNKKQTKTKTKKKKKKKKKKK